MWCKCCTCVRLVDGAEFTTRAQLRPRDRGGPLPLLHTTREQEESGPERLGLTGGDYESETQGQRSLHSRTTALPPPEAAG